MKSGYLIRSAIFLPAFFCSLGVSQDSNWEQWDKISSVPEAKAIEIGSLFDATYANNLSWQQGDVLIRTNTIWDSTEIPQEGDIVIELIEFHRFRFDFKNKRFAFVHSQKQEIPLLVFPDGTSQSVESESSIRGFVKNDDGVYIRDFPAKVRKYKKEPDLQKLFSRYFVPEIRAIGIAPFGSNATLAGLKSAVMRQSSGEGIISVNKKDDDKLEWVRRTSVPGKDDLFFIQETVFDIANLVPISELVSVESVIDGKLAKHQQYEERFEWDEIKSINVPISIFRECLSSRRIGEHSFVALKSIDVSINWIDLNSKLEDSAFDDDMLREFDMMVKFVDEKSIKNTQNSK